LEVETASRSLELPTVAFVLIVEDLTYKGLRFTMDVAEEIRLV
jgi:hypothetical protein